MKKFIEKLAEIFKKIFGYGIMITLFAGGFTLFGYIAALLIGGSAAAAICTFIYDKLFPVIIYGTSVLILLGLVTMYLSGEKALVSAKKEKKAK